MASTGHLELSNFIKSVHQNLRESSKTIGAEKAWKLHCNNEEVLKKYACAMKDLSCQYWEPNNESTTKSRIEWTTNTCLNYFLKEVCKFRDKEKEICEKINLKFTFNVKQAYHLDKLKLLDVGSCYNPFKKFGFDVTAIDIAPAIRDVFKCDFLSVKVGDKFFYDAVGLKEIPENYFHIVVFSLVLEYLPSPKQRFLCCEKSYKLLKNEGLLVIITPDSNHVGVNAKYMKSWRYVLAKMGFSRIKYEKLQHLQCMAFRKTISKAVAYRWAELHVNEQLFEEIYIPQDFTQRFQLENVTKTTKDIREIESVGRDFQELPQCNIFQ